MFRSMTGFGRGEYSDGKKTITVEIKSVNHRYCDIYVKMPRRYSFAEERIKAAVKERLIRGKIEVSVMVDNFGESETEVRLNRDAAEKYYAALRALEEAFDLGDNRESYLRILAGMPDVIKAAPISDDEEEIIRTLLIPTGIALDNITHMREVEGTKLAEDLAQRTDTVERIKDVIAERAPQIQQEYADKMRDRIKELVGDAIEVPAERILLEAAIFADKANITEELVRLGSHIAQMRSYLNGTEPAIGKKMDFLIQEMNREANTIGSKSNDGAITSMMLDLKAEIEKIREQVQNIE
ncbi:MAG: YicC family protein [Mogibacterium sp.]|nr:YicC family protein [Mogibacterium sp.]